MYCLSLRVNLFIIENKLYDQHFVSCNFLGKIYGYLNDNDKLTITSNGSNQ